MLAKANRITAAADFRSAVRRGRRVSTAAAVLHIVDRTGLDAGRFGFLVTKSVGNAVMRNLVRRRLRSVARDLLSGIPAGTDVVMRALPGADKVPWVTMHAEIAQGLERSGARA